MSPISQYFQKPIYQGTAFILLTIVIALIIRPKSVDSFWVIAGLVFAAFLIFNSVFIAFADAIWIYFFYSIGISILYLLTISVIAPLLIRMLNAGGSGESSMIFLMIIYHPVLLLLGIFIKWMVGKLF
jgi:hypothetical protein